MLTRDHHRLGRHKTRLLNQIEVTLKEYYPRPLEVFSDLESKIALDFLEQYPTPRALSELTRRNWNRFAKREHRLGEQRCKELWEKLSQPQLKIPEHVVRTKAQLLLVLVIQLRSLAEAVKNYSEGLNVFSPLCRQLSLLRRCREEKVAAPCPCFGLSSVMRRVAGDLFVTFKPRRVECR